MLVLRVFFFLLLLLESLNFKSESLCSYSALFNRLWTNSVTWVLKSRAEIFFKNVQKLVYVKGGCVGDGLQLTWDWWKVSALSSLNIRTPHILQWLPSASPMGRTETLIIGSGASWKGLPGWESLQLRASYVKELSLLSFAYFSFCNPDFTLLSQPLKGWAGICSLESQCPV